MSGACAAGEREHAHTNTNGRGVRGPARTSKPIENDREEVDPPRWGGSARPGLEPGPRRLTCSSARTRTAGMCKFASERLPTAILKTRLRATCDFCIFSAPLRVLEQSANQRHTPARVHHNNEQDSARGNSRAAAAEQQQRPCSINQGCNGSACTSVQEQTRRGSRTPKPTERPYQTRTQPEEQASEERQPLNGKSAW